MFIKKFSESNFILWQEFLHCKERKQTRAESCQELGVVLEGMN